MTSTGRRGYVGIDRRWISNPDLSDTALRFMLWLDSHSDEYLAAMNIARSAEQLGWGRNRVKRAIEELEALSLISTEQIDRRGGGTVTRFTLHLDEWSDGPRWTSAMVHGDAPAMVHGDAPSTSTPNIEESSLETTPSTLDGLSEFETFFDAVWNEYPRKVGKPAARKAMKAKYNPINRNFIAYGIRKWIFHWERSGTEMQFIPHPATFLNQERYNDEPPPVVATTPKPNTPMGILQAIANRDNQ